MFRRVNLGTDFDGFPRVPTGLMSLLGAHFAMCCTLTIVNHLCMHHYVDYKMLKCFTCYNLEIQHKKSPKNQASTTALKFGKVNIP
jgi:hypothetical protein